MTSRLFFGLVPFKLAAALVAAFPALLHAQLTRTPSLTEGPFYTFNSSQRLPAPADQDADLTTIVPGSSAAQGTLFLLSGTLVNLQGIPLAGAVIELWHTDNGGVYYHSSDSLVSRRDTLFQGFGRATTDSSGRFAFRTVRPGLYTGRIRHFHLKVKINGGEVLTSQFVFEDQRSSFSSDNVTSSLSGASLEAIVLNPSLGTDANGNSALLATKQIVVNATASVSGTAPSLTTQPSPAAIGVGQSTAFSVTASGSSPLSYQWYKDGVALVGANADTYTLSAATTNSAGAYTVVVANSAGSVTSAAASLLVTPITTTHVLSNLSTRAYLPSSTGVMIAGFIVQGSDGKRVLVRAVGPTLSSLNVPGSLVSDPRLEIYDANGTKVAENDSWDPALSSLFSSLGAFALPSSSKDAALTVTLGNGSATAQLRGDSAGVALIEAYGTSDGSTARLINLSSRAFVGGGEAALIAGFIISGNGGKQLLIRGIGPKLTDFQVSGALSDPKIEVYNSAGVKLAENDNWDASLAQSFRQLGAFDLPTGSKDAAMVVTLPAGAAYTAVITGVGGVAGEALVELYELP